MQITTKDLQARLELLQKEQAQMRANLEQVNLTKTELEFNISAYNGAIEDVQYWLSQMAQEEAKKGGKENDATNQRQPES